MFERYHDIVPDPEGFEDALRRPMDTHIRVNPARIEPADFAARVRTAGHELEPVGWYGQAFRVPETLARPGNTLEYALGMYHIQGLTSMVPPLALDPRPGERVLDLCAAPGSKTTQLCELMQDQGLVVANDLFFDRLKVVKGHLERLGHVCAVITRRSGENWPNGLTFDRVLVDAPCSGEGTARGASGLGRDRSRRGELEGGMAPLEADGSGRGPDRREEGEVLAPPRERPDRRDRRGGKPREGKERLLRLQRGLLKRAAALVRPGGVIVYSTCTYDPLENEAAVDDLLSWRADLEVEEIPVDVPGAEPGITRHAGTSFRSTIARARRFYPHRVNSWGFFVARLRRVCRLADQAGTEDALAAAPAATA